MVIFTRRTIWYFLWMSLFISSCGDVIKEIKSESLGRPGQVILVIENELWDAETGKAIRSHFHQAYPGLNAREYYFDITQYNHSEFSRTIKSYRNIINIEFADSDKYKEPVVKIKEDVWALNQLYIHIIAKDLKGLNDYILKNFGKIGEVIDEREKERIMKQYRTFRHPNIEEILHNRFRIHLSLPKNTVLVKEDENFLWLRHEDFKYLKGSGSHQVEKGILVFSEPYINEAMLDKKYILLWRDEVMKKHVSGELEGTYMTTEYDSSYYPKETLLSVADQYAVQIRNLWYIAGSKKVFMGGPFISVTFYNPLTENLVTIAGYVYAPHFNKREYMRELEAILYSVVFVDPQS